MYVSEIFTTQAYIYYTYLYANICNIRVKRYEYIVITNKNKVTRIYSFFFKCRIKDNAIVAIRICGVWWFSVITSVSGKLWYQYPWMLQMRVINPVLDFSSQIDPTNWVNLKKILRLVKLGHFDQCSSFSVG